MKLCTLSIFLFSSMVPFCAHSGPLGFLKQLLFPNTPAAVQPQNSMAIIRLEDDIDSDSIKPVMQKFIQARQDPNVQGILLIISSGGGSAGAADLLFNEVQRAAHQKPVVTLVEDLCASGAYHIASATNWIIAPSMANVGSIGVWRKIERHTDTHLVNQNGLCAAVSIEILQAGKYKTLSHPHTHSLTEEERAYLKAEVEKIYDVFVASVAHQRNLNLEQTDEWAEGKIFIASEAREVGLIDQIGGYSDAIEKLKELIRQSEEYVEKDWREYEMAGGQRNSPTTRSVPFLSLDYLTNPDQA